MSVIAGEVLSEGAGGESQPGRVGAALAVLLQPVLITVIHCTAQRVPYG